MKHFQILIITILVLLVSCLKDDELKLKTIKYQPVELNDGWGLSPASSVNFNMDILDELMDSIYSEDHFLQIHSMVIVKDGKLVAEAYPRTLSDRTTPRQLWSTTKSFISMLTGIAVDKGFIHSENDSIFSYIPEYLTYSYPELKSLTIEQCLTMRSGIDYDNDGDEEEDLLASVPADLTRYIVERPMKSIPGKEAYYKNSDPQLLVKVVSNASNTDFVEFADSNLFSPLGIKNYYWSRNRDNTPYGGFGLWLTPRDLAKVGQMLLANGTYNNQRILSEQWITKATTNKTKINGFDYGYLFWLHPDRKYYWTWGAGGQYIFVVPEKALVIVITSEQFGDEHYTTINEARYLVEKVIEGIR